MLLSWSGWKAAADPMEAAAIQSARVKKVTKTMRQKRSYWQPVGWKLSRIEVLGSWSYLAREAAEKDCWMNLHGLERRWPQSRLEGHSFLRSGSEAELPRRTAEDETASLLTIEVC